MIYHRIIDELKRYVSGNSDERDLERWMISNYQQTLDSGEESAMVLANEINSLFIEGSEGLASKEEIPSALAEILMREESSVSFKMGQNPNHVAAAKTVHKRLRTTGQITDVYLTFQAV